MDVGKTANCSRMMLSGPGLDSLLFSLPLATYSTCTSIECLLVALPPATLYLKQHLLDGGMGLMEKHGEAGSIHLEFRVCQYS